MGPFLIPVGNKEWPRILTSGPQLGYLDGLLSNLYNSSRSRRHVLAIQPEITSNLSRFALGVGSWILISWSSFQKSEMCISRGRLDIIATLPKAMPRNLGMSC